MTATFRRTHNPGNACRCRRKDPQLQTPITLDAVLAHSPDVAARQVGGRVVIVPLHADPGDTLDDLFTLNKTGQAIWELLDGSRPLHEVVTALAVRFEVTADVLVADVSGFVTDLTERGMLRVEA